MSQASVSPMRVRFHRLLHQMKQQMQRFRHAMFSWRTLISVIGIALAALLFAINITPVRYNISVGMVPTHTITATRDVVDEITTESLRSAAEKAVQPTYVMKDGVLDSVLSNLNQIYAQFDAAIQYAETLEDYSSTRRYTADELAKAREIVTMIALKDYQMRTLLNTTRSDLSDLYSNLFDAIQNTMSGYIIEGSEHIAISNIMQIIGYRTDTNLLQNVVQPLLDVIIKPNIIIDQEATELARQQARGDVEPVVYKQGQNIIVKGEGRVERYQYEMLSSMGLLSNASIDITMYLGVILLVVLTMSIAMIMLRITRKQIVYDIKRLVLLFIIVLLTLLICVLMRPINIYLAPAALSALLLSSMLGLHAGIIFNAAVAVLIGTLANNSASGSLTGEMAQILMAFLCSGTVGAMVLYKRSNRLRVIASGIAVGAVNFAVLLALGLMAGSNKDTVLLNALWGLGGGAISGVLCIAIQPLLELLFNLPTPTKLMELSNPNHPLLRRLLLEAPGTYHHSIVVSSLAEAAAEAIGANPLLARVGGYYHDVGKLRRPLYFKENQLGEENKLIETNPYTAAQIVISHTRDGAMLARQYHLPREVIRIIQEHHGNTPVMYFYTMALKEADGKPVDVNEFRYDADPPSTKEGAIVLLCDTIEAAVRSMQNPTPEAIEEFIIKLIQGKLQDGQLSNSPLTLKDIDDICHACVTVLNGVFHERIEYPEPPEEKAHHKSKRRHEDRGAQKVDKSLTQPWDGVSSEDKDAPRKERGAAKARASAEEILIPAQQIPIDMADFEAEEPLTPVEIPQMEAIPTVEELMGEIESLDAPVRKDDGIEKTEEKDQK